MRLLNAGHIGRAPPPRRILLLALLPIGDTLFITPTIRSLRERYPRTRITALVHASAAPILRSVQGVDEAVVLPFGPDWTGAGALVRTLRYLRSHLFDVASDLPTPAYKSVCFAC